MPQYGSRYVFGGGGFGLETIFTSRQGTFSTAPSGELVYLEPTETAQLPTQEPQEPLYLQPTGTVQLQPQMYPVPLAPAEPVPPGSVSWGPSAYAPPPTSAYAAAPSALPLHLATADACQAVFNTLTTTQQLECDKLIIARDQAQQIAKASPQQVTPQLFPSELPPAQKYVPPTPSYVPAPPQPKPQAPTCPPGYLYSPQHQACAKIASQGYGPQAQAGGGAATLAVVGGAAALLLLLLGRK